MTRGGRNKMRDEPERRCIVTGAVGPKSGLIRFVLGPDGDIVPDIAGKLPGRGIWVSSDRKALEKAVAKGLFARAAKRPVKALPDLVDRTEAALLRRVVEMISLARKAGEAVAGFEKVKDWLEKGRAVVLIQASDGSERGKSKLWPPEPDEDGRDVFIGCLAAQEIGLAFGREHVIHAALAAGGLSTRVVEDAARLAGMRGRIGASVAGKD
jgi:predicted RNA-binding protein YlxR (DUF448 family)